MPSGVVIYGVEDTLAAVLEIRKSSRGEICWLVPPSLLALSLDYNILRLATQFTEEGGVIRGITTVMPTNLDTVRAELDIGEDVRHTDSLSSELFMYIGDRQHSISSINVGVKEYTHDTALTCFKSSDPTYAEYLLTSFESAWSQAVPAKERIQALAREAGQR